MGIASKIWAKDAGLWPASSDDPSATANGLGWLDLPRQFAALTRTARALADELKRDGVRRVVVLGMGGSSMTGEALRLMFGVSESRLRVLDTLHPAALADLGDDLDATAFIVGSKSGTTLETLTLEDYFRRRLSADKAPREVARHFIAVSDPDTALTRRGQDKEQFRRAFESPPTVGGRFSALSVFGILPFALAGGEADAFAAPLDKMARDLQTDAAANPGVKLGRFFSAAATNGAAQITLATSPKLAGFNLWAEQLLAESTGKDGKGLIPITGEAFDETPIAAYKHGRNVVVMRLRGDDNAALDARRAELRERGVNIYEIELSSLDEIGAQFLMWEFATAVAGADLQLNAFDQPDVESAKKRARDLLASADRIDALPNATPPSALKQALLDATRAANAAERAPDYIAILAYLKPDPAADACFARLRGALTRLTGLPTLFGYGPRYLHSTGQLLKGGPPTALALGLWSAPPPQAQADSDAARLTDLMNAQARADFEIMSERGQRVITTQLNRDFHADLTRQNALIAALNR